VPEPVSTQRHIRRHSTVRGRQESQRTDRLLQEDSERELNADRVRVLVRRHRQAQAQREQQLVSGGLSAQEEVRSRTDEAQHRASPAQESRGVETGL